jgi:predicted SAM-dependent methyltransferase
MQTPIGIGAVISTPSRAGTPSHPATGLHPLAVMAHHNALSMIPINFTPRLHRPLNLLVDQARNEASALAIDSGAQYLIFLDDDVLVPPNCLKQLTYRLDNWPEIDVVAGVYCNKGPAPGPLVFRGNGQGPYWRWKIGDFFPITGCGMGMTIIRTSLLLRLRQSDPAKPFFLTEAHVRQDPKGDTRELFRRTEDLYFCNRALEECDARIYCDGSLTARHIKHDTGEEFYLPQDSYPMRPVGTPKGKKIILDLGCGQTDAYFPNEGAAIRVDLREDGQPDYVCDVRQLPFDDHYADVVYSSHTLEHFGRWETETVLDEWLRVLKPGGELRLVIPDVTWAAQEIVGGKYSADACNVLYGQQEYSLNYHKMGFTPALIRTLLEERGLKITRCDTEGYNIIISATKPKPRRRPTSRKPQKKQKLTKKKKRKKPAAKKKRKK